MQSQKIKSKKLKLIIKKWDCPVCGGKGEDRGFISIVLPVFCVKKPYPCKKCGTEKHSKTYSKYNDIIAKQLAR